ncbi:MAG: prolyl aminopeptidase [Proteobacteria bacterium]|nr:prolyl aminopeptidase [Pseudomonadota bacterium]
MQAFFPPIKIYAEHKLKVSSIHELHIEECGNPDGLPVLVVHDGPGTGCEEYHRRFFDPEVYRIILFDQRGAGRSTPHAELNENTTQDLISDIEAIRNHLHIKKWILFGGSWGALLSLLYAETHPQVVAGLIVFSVFLGREKDINWFYQKGANLFFPDYWEEFIQPFPKEEQDNILMAYNKRLTGNDELARMSAAKAWSLWQARCSTLQPHANVIDHFSDPHLAVGLASIESHYFLNRCFLEENQVLDNIDKISNIPGYIIHGRYDVMSPLKRAWELHKAWPSSELYIVRDAGHAAKEPGIIDALILATKKMSKHHLTAC